MNYDLHGLIEEKHLEQISLIQKIIIMIKKVNKSSFSDFFKSTVYAVFLKLYYIKKTIEELNWERH